MRSTCANLCLLVAVVFAASATAPAQKPNPNPGGPVPPAIIHAKSIFVSNSDSDRDLFPGIYSEGHELPYQFTGDDTRPYSEFYSALASTGDYHLAADPSQADLVLELQLRAHLNPATSTPGPLAELRLVVYGSQSHYILWTITQAVEPAYLLKHRDQNFEAAITNLLNQFLEVAGKTPTPAH